MTNETMDGPRAPKGAHEGARATHSRPLVGPTLMYQIPDSAGRFGLPAESVVPCRGDRRIN